MDTDKLWELVRHYNDLSLTYKGVAEEITKAILSATEG